VNSKRYFVSSGKTVSIKLERIKLCDVRAFFHCDCVYGVYLLNSINNIHTYFIPIKRTKN